MKAIVIDPQCEAIKNAEYAEDARGDVQMAENVLGEKAMFHKKLRNGDKIYITANSKVDHSKPSFLFNEISGLIFGKAVIMRFKSKKPLGIPVRCQSNMRLLEKQIRFLKPEDPAEVVEGSEVSSSSI